MANLSNINDKFVVDTAGNIGVGTLVPRSDANTTNISIQSSGTARLFVNNTGASGKEYAIYSSANGDFGIFDYGAVSARLIINSSGNATFAGNVGIGTDSADGKLNVVDTSNPATTSGSVIIEGRRDGGANVLTLRAKDASAPTSALPNGQGAVLRWQGFDGTDFENMGYIYVAADGQAVANADAPSYMSFGTSGDGSSTPTERMSITSGGNVLIGGFAANGSVSPILNGFGFTPSGTGTVVCNFSDTNEMIVLNQRDGQGTTQFEFRNGNVERGRIEWTTSGTTYNTISDYRLKENITNLTGSLAKINQLEPKVFNFISDPDDPKIGFIAHEVQDIVPQAVTGVRDDIREDGTPKYQGLDHSMLVPLLVGAIKELKTDNDNLRERIQTLENQ